MFINPDLSPEDAGEVVQELTGDDSLEVVSLHDSDEESEDEIEDVEITPPKSVKTKVTPRPTVTSKPTLPKPRPVVELVHRTASNIRVEGRIPPPPPQPITPSGRSGQSDKRSRGKKRQTSPSLLSSTPRSSRTRATSLAELREQIPETPGRNISEISQEIAKEPLVCYIQFWMIFKSLLTLSYRWCPCAPIVLSATIRPVPSAAGMRTAISARRANALNAPSRSLRPREFWRRTYWLPRHAVIISVMFRLFIHSFMLNVLSDIARAVKAFGDAQASYLLHSALALHARKDMIDSSEALANHLQDTFATAVGNPADLNAHFHEQAREFLLSLDDSQFLDRTFDLFSLNEHFATPFLQARLSSLLPGLSRSDTSGGDVSVPSEVSASSSSVAGPSTLPQVVSPQVPPAKRARRGAAAPAATETSMSAPSSFPLSPATFSPLSGTSAPLPPSGRVSRSASRGSGISATGSHGSGRLSTQGSQTDLKRKRRTGGN